MTLIKKTKKKLVLFFIILSIYPIQSYAGSFFKDTKDNASSKEVDVSQPVKDNASSKEVDVSQPVKDNASSKEVDVSQPVKDNASSKGISQPTKTKQPYQKNKKNGKQPIADKQDVEIISFVNKRISVGQNGSIDDLINFYAERILFNGQQITTEILIQKLTYDINNWPIRKQTLLGNIIVSKGMQPSSKVATYTTNFIKSNPQIDKTISGIITKTITIENSSVGFRIIDEKMYITLDPVKAKY